MKKNGLWLFLATLIFAACESPEAAFDFQLSKTESPIDITFANHSKSATSYFWDFGDGYTSTEENPTHRYNFWGTYNVTLTAFKGKKEHKTVQSFTLKKPKRTLVEIETEFGVMKAELFNFTPLHRDNFIKLAKEGYYDGLLFHRVIEGFMIQGGDPNSRNAPLDRPLGDGNPGYTIPAEVVHGAYHYKGALAAARTSDAINPQKASSGSQFYIVQGTPLSELQMEQYTQQKAMKGIYYSSAQQEFFRTQGGVPMLDGEYTVFGQVVEGLHLIDQIAKVAKNPSDRPLKDIKMKVRVLE